MSDVVLLQIVALMAFVGFFGAGASVLRCFWKDRSTESGQEMIAWAVWVMLMAFVVAAVILNAAQRAEHRNADSVKRQEVRAGVAE